MVKLAVDYECGWYVAPSCIIVLDCLGDVNERLEAIRNQRLETIKNIQVWFNYLIYVLAPQM